jgi:hypothetical protein
LVFCVAKGNNRAHIIIRNAIEAAAVWYRLEAFTNAGPDTTCKFSCGWGHIENPCGKKPKCGYGSGVHWTSNHMCNLVGSTARQGSLYGNTLDECPNSRRNQIAFGWRCAKKPQAAPAARQHTVRASAGSAPRNEAPDTTTGTITLVFCHRPRGGRAADAGRNEKAHTEDEEATGEAHNIMMTETEITTTTATDTQAEALATIH